MPFKISVGCSNSRIFLKINLQYGTYLEYNFRNLLKYKSFYKYFWTAGSESFDKQKFLDTAIEE